MHNITIDLKLFGQLPDGTFKSNLHFYNKFDDNILTIMTLAEVGGTLSKDF
jgi:hypothetical protein